MAVIARLCRTSCRSKPLSMKRGQGKRLDRSGGSGGSGGKGATEAAETAVFDVDSLSDVEVFDPASQLWNHLPRMSLVRIGHCMD